MRSERRKVRGARPGPWVEHEDVLCARRADLENADAVVLRRRPGRVEAGDADERGLGLGGGGAVARASAAVPASKNRDWNTFDSVNHAPALAPRGLARPAARAERRGRRLLL